MFAPTNYAEGLDNKAAVGMSKDVEGGCKVKLFANSLNLIKTYKTCIR